MIRSLKLLEAAIFLLVSILPSVLFAQSVGQAVGVSQNAFLNRDGREGYLEPGGDVLLGDVITTGNSGQVQIVFKDGTKIAISQNSSLVIERILFDSSNTASEFTVNAVGGAFRFFSGNSSPSSYSIRTSNATMGIRGTAFDFAASTRGQVRVATFAGEVQLCNQAGQCVAIPDGCTTAGIDSSGQFIVPENEEERAVFLEAGFPYVRNQSWLRQDFRTDVRSCGAGGSSGVDGRDEGRAPSPEPPAPDPTNPATGGARAGGESSAGSGGSTAGDTDAGRGGPGAPGDAEAAGGEASAGGPGGASAGGGGASAGK
jgi:hypothetical protein